MSPGKLLRVTACEKLYCITHKNICKIAMVQAGLCPFINNWQRQPFMPPHHASIPNNHLAGIIPYILHRSKVTDSSLLLMLYSFPSRFSTTCFFEMNSIKKNLILYNEAVETCQDKNLPFHWYFHFYTNTNQNIRSPSRAVILLRDTHHNVSRSRALFL